MAAFRLFPGPPALDDLLEAYADQRDDTSSLFRQKQWRQSSLANAQVLPPPAPAPAPAPAPGPGPLPESSASSAAAAGASVSNPLTRASFISSTFSSRQKSHSSILAQATDEATARVETGTSNSSSRTRKHGGTRSTSSSTTTEWNGSTQPDSLRAPRPLVHQILCPNFASPAPVVLPQSKVRASVQRVSKSTVASRLKKAPPMSKEASTRTSIALQQRLHSGQYHGSDTTVNVTPGSPLHKQKHAALNFSSKHSTSNAVGVLEVDTDADHGNNSSSNNNNNNNKSPDIRAQEGIHLLLFYRREVAKRMEMQGQVVQ